MRRRLRRLVCAVLRHRPVTVIDRVEFVTAGPVGVEGRVRAKHRECRYCEARL